MGAKEDYGRTFVKDRRKYKRSGSKVRKALRYSRSTRYNPRADTRLVSNNQGILIPDKTFVTLKYNDDISLGVPISGNVQSYLFRCNSIFDPDSSGIGHQPLGHDQYAGFYKKYCVVASTITVTFKTYENGSETNQDNTNFTCGIGVIQDASGTITNPREFCENNRVSYTNISAQEPMKAVTKKFVAKEFFGLTRILDNKDYGANFGANPTEEAYFQVGAYLPSQPTTSNRLYFNVAIKYHCCLRERVNIGIS